MKPSPCCLVLSLSGALLALAITVGGYPDKPYPKVTGYMDHIDGVIRNNVIHTTATGAKYYDTGVELAQAMGAKVYHNTMVTKPVWSSIDSRYTNTLSTIRNNLVYKITKRQGGQATADHNLSAAPLSLFVDPVKVNYHLKATATAAINMGVTLGAAGGLDMDGKAHDNGLPDLGAHEYR